VAIFIDSANPKELKAACDLGWISGVTTNPLILRQAISKPESILAGIKQLTSGPIFYQAQATSFEKVLAEADQAQGILEDQLVLKLPPNTLGFKVCAQLSSRIRCCPTAIFSPAQALIARAAGAQYLAVYVNRANRLMDDGIQLLSEIAQILAGSGTALLAASIKSPAEAVSAIQAGAQHLTLPYQTLIQMPQQALSEAAIAEFYQDGVGLD